MIPDFSNYITLTCCSSWSIDHQQYFAFSLVLSSPFMLFTCVQCFFLFFSPTRAPKCSLKWHPSLSLMKEVVVQGLMANDTGLLCVWPSHLYLLCQITSTWFCCVLPCRFSFLMVSGQLSKRIETQTNAESAYLTYFTRHTFCRNKEIRYLH